MRHLTSLDLFRSTAFAVLFASLVHSHSVIVYPGWRGNNLHTNGTVEELNGLGVGIGNNSELAYPYGMQWTYPCGGMPTTTNRTKWPVEGGAVSFQPGWFPGHETAFIYINLGLGTVPENMSHVMLPPFQIAAPTNNPYAGTFCMPQVPLPKGIEVNVGDNATIQLIEAAQHGAALHNCVDITFAEPDEVEEVTQENCFNSSHIGHRYVVSMDSDENAAPSTGVGHASIVSLLLLTYFVFGL